MYIMHNYNEIKNDKDNNQYLIWIIYQRIIIYRQIDDF